MLTDQVSLILLIVYMVTGLVLYHKIFIVIYFDLAGGVFREIAVCFFFSLIMTGLTLYKWKIALIVVIIGGLIILCKCSNGATKGLAVFGTIILSAVIAYAGMDFSKRMEEDNQSTNKKEHVLFTKKNVNDEKMEDNSEKNSDNEQYQQENTDDVDVFQNSISEEDDEEYTSDDLNEAETRWMNQNTITGEEEAKEKISDKGEYIFADSDIKLLSRKQLKSLSKTECRYARNEIYARHGRLFNDSELQDYFNTKSWYEGTIKPENFKETMLSSIEKKNVKMIKKYEDRR